MNNYNDYPGVRNAGAYDAKEVQSVNFLSLSRIGRRTFAMYIVAAFALLYISAYMADVTLGEFELETIAILSGLFAVTVIPTYAGIRRLHDINRSGWVILWSLVPLSIVLLIVALLLVPGTKGPNKYGDRERFVTQA